MGPLDGARSLLFGPAADERKVTNALQAGADAVIADLEDSVSASEKARAREILERVLTARPQSNCARMIRINAVDTGFFEEDRRLLERTKPDAVVLPKATPAAVTELGRRGPPVLAIVETALGLQLSGETARAGRVAALALGAVDLGRELGLQPRGDGLEILFARSKLVVDSAAAEIRAPLDVVHLEVRDTAGLEQSARLARSLGFGGKLCIHPGQVPVVNDVFTPSQDEVRWAERVISGYERAQRDGKGVLALDGQMVDLPVVQRARSILAGAGRRSA